MHRGSSSAADGRGVSPQRPNTQRTFSSLGAAAQSSVAAKQSAQHHFVRNGSLNNTSSSTHHGSMYGDSGATANQPETDQPGWHVVDAKRGGRSWAKLYVQFERLLDDLYLTCELDCNQQHVDAVVQALHDSFGDFTELAQQIRRINQPRDAVAWEVKPHRRAGSRSPRPAAASDAAGGAEHHFSPAHHTGSQSRHYTDTAAAAPSRAAAGAAQHQPIAAGSAAAAAAATASGPFVRASWPAALPPAASGMPAAPAAAAAAAALWQQAGGSSCRGPGGSSGGGHPDAQLPAAPAAAAAAVDPAAAAAHAAAAAATAGGSRRLSVSSLGGTSQAGEEGCGSSVWREKVDWGTVFNGRSGSTGGSAAAAGSSQPPHQPHHQPYQLPHPLPSLQLPPSPGGPVSPSSHLDTRHGDIPRPATATSHLFQKLMSPGRRRSPSETKRASDEKQARAERLREALVEERMAKLARAKAGRESAKSVKEVRVEQIQSRFEEKLARSSELRQAHLATIVQRANDEARKVAEVAFINALLGEDKKLSLQQKLEEGEARRREIMGEKLAKQKEAAAALEEAAERRRAAEEARQAELAEKQRRKELAKAAFLAKQEEDRRAAAAAREATKEQQRAAASELAAAQERQAVLLGSRIEERLREATCRRERHLEMVRERAALLERRPDGSASSTALPSPRSPAAAPGGAAGGMYHHHHSLSRSGRLLLLEGGALTPSSVASPADPGQAAFSGRGPSGSGAAAGASTPSAAAVSAAAAASAAGAAALVQFRSGDRSVTGAMSVKNRFKGLRRRAAKVLVQLQAGRFELPPPHEWTQLLATPDGTALMHRWSRLASAAAAAAAEARSNANKKKSRAAVAPAAVGASASGAAADAADISTSRSDQDVRAAKVQQQAAAAPGSDSRGGLSVEQLQHELLSVVTSDLLKRPRLAAAAAAPSGMLQLLCSLAAGAGGAAAAQSGADAAGELLLRLLQAPHNVDVLLATALVPDLVTAATSALDRANSASSDELVEEGAHLTVMLQVLTLITRPRPAAAPAGASQQQQQQQQSPQQQHHHDQGEQQRQQDADEQQHQQQQQAPLHPQHRLCGQQSLTVAYCAACGIIHRLSELFTLLDQPQGSTAPIPHYVLQGLLLLEALTGRPPDAALALTLVSSKGKGVDSRIAARWVPGDANASSLSLAFQETAMAGLPLLLTAVLLHAAPSCTPAEAVPERLPPNFVDVALSVMRVLNNVARLDLPALQSSLASNDLRLGFFHLTAFLISYATNMWPRGCTAATLIEALAAGAHGGTAAAQPLPLPAAGRAAGAQQQQQQSPPWAAAAAAKQPGGGADHESRQVPGGGSGSSTPPECGIVALLHEVLLLIGHFAVLSPTNQVMLTWGRTPSILQRLCQVPFPYFAVPQLRQVLLPTLAACCYDHPRVCELVEAAVGAETVLAGLQELKAAAEEGDAAGGSSGAATAGLPARYSLRERLPVALLPEITAFFQQRSAA